MEQQDLAFATVAIGAATIIAVIVGPILAVLVTRYVDEQRAGKARRWDVFRTLMRTRREVLSPDFVGALNLIEVEFHGEDAVIQAWKELLKIYNKVPAKEADEVQAELKAMDDRRVDLLDAMAKSLKLEIQQLDILRGGYSPMAWSNDLEAQRLLRAVATDVFAGRRGLPIHVVSLPRDDAPSVAVQQG